MEKRYRVIFKGLTDSAEKFREALLQKGVDQTAIAQILAKTPIILKAGLTIKTAREYAAFFEQAGAQIRIQENGFNEDASTGRSAFLIKPLQDFTMCPECGLKQLKTASCQKCGSKLKT